MPAAESSPGPDQLALAELEADIPALLDRAARLGWVVDYDLSKLVVVIHMTHSSSGELYVLRGVFDTFRTLPPAWEFLDPDTGEEGTAAAYPMPVPPPENPNGLSPVVISSGSRGRVICLPCNRRAYREFDDKAPHQDWKLVNWSNQSPAYNSVEEMVSRIAQDVQLSTARWGKRAGTVPEVH
jgi:hypothetical protein